MHFLNYLADTSNNVCNAEGKKTITPSHVVRALQELKMNSYIIDLLKMGEEEDNDMGDEVAKGSSNDEEMVSA